MDLEVIKEKYRKGEYTPDINMTMGKKLIPISRALDTRKNPLFDRNKTIAENEEMAKDYNKEIAKQHEKMQQQIREAHNKLMQDIITAIKEIIKVDDGKAKIIYERAYDNHHSGGMMDVFMELDEELDYLMKIL